MRTREPNRLLDSRPDCRYRVIGASGSGKSSVSGLRLVRTTGSSPNYIQFITLANGSNRQSGINLKSLTAEAQLTDEFTLDGRMVTLLDTPGFDGTPKGEADLLKMVADFLTTT